MPSSDVKFLEIRWSDTENLQSIALCAGFELGSWRAEQLADHLMDWLPDFALTPEEQAYFAGEVWTLLKSAATRIYSVERTEITEQRGEVGELFLHIACVQELATAPAILTVFYKSATNDNVKGFDCVHFKRSFTTGQIELWLGEAKFYTDGSDAIKKAVETIRLHMEGGFLKEQKALIQGKIALDDKDSKDLKALLNSKTSLDELLSRLHVPVLITYNSKAATDATALSESYIAELKSECDALRQKFSQAAKDVSVTFHLILIPLATKEMLLQHFDKRLGVLQ